MSFSFLECMECIVGAMTTVAVGCLTYALLSLVTMRRKESCVSSDDGPRPGTYFSQQQALEHIIVIYSAMHINVDVINCHHHLGEGQRGNHP